MSAFSPKNAGISPAFPAEVTTMTAHAEARALMLDIVGPSDCGTQIKQMLTHVARSSGIGLRRLRGIWNSEARLIRAEELDALRRAAAARKAGRRAAQEADLHDELRRLKEHITTLEQRMAESDPKQTRQAVDEHREAAGGFGGVDRAMADGSEGVAIDQSEWFRQHVRRTPASRV